MKKTTKQKLEKYQATLEYAVKAGTKLNAARKALEELNATPAIETALLEIKGNLAHYNSVVKNIMHKIAVLELKEGI